MLDRSWVRAAARWKAKNCCKLEKFAAVSSFYSLWFYYIFFAGLLSFFSRYHIPEEFNFSFLTRLSLVIRINIWSENVLNNLIKSPRWRLSFCEMLSCFISLFAYNQPEVDVTDFEFIYDFFLRFTTKKFALMRKKTTQNAAELILTTWKRTKNFEISIPRLVSLFLP